MRDKDAPAPGAPPWIAKGRSRRLGLDGGNVGGPVAPEPGAPAAGGFPFGARPRAERGALGLVRRQEPDLFADRLPALELVGASRHARAEREPALALRRDIDEVLDQSREAPGLIARVTDRAETDRLFRVLNRIRAGVASQALVAPWALGGRRAVADRGRLAEVAALLEEDHRGLHQVAVGEIFLLQDGAGVKGIVRLDRDERGRLGARRAMMRVVIVARPFGAGRGLARVMLRAGGGEPGAVYGVLHEGSAPAALPLPVLGQRVTGLQGPRQIVVQEGRQPVAQRVEALKADEAVGGIGAVGRADAVDPLGALRRGWIEHVLQVGLDDAVIAAGLEELGAAPEGLSDVLVLVIGGDSDDVGVHVAVALDVAIELGDGGEGVHRRPNPGARQHLQQSLFITGVFLLALLA